MSENLPGPAWHPDPYGRSELRYWDGSRWTEHVSTAGVQGLDVVEAAQETQAEVWFNAPQCDYLGSHPWIPNPIDKVGVAIHSHGVLIYQFVWGTQHDIVALRW